MLIHFKFWYQDGSGKEEDISKEVDYIPDQILYRDNWWKLNGSAYDFDTGKYTRVHYKQVIR